MDETDFPFTHTDSHEPTDPVNVVIRGITFDELSQFLTTNSDWGTTSASYGRYLPLPETRDELDISGELVYPKSPWGIWDRIHLRLWNLSADPVNLPQPTLVGNVHRDATKLGHVAANFEAAKTFFVRECRLNALWEARAHEVELQNRLCTFERPFHCGRAALIEPKRAGV